MQTSKTFVQINTAPPEVVFPLLCPVREKDWVDGWDYQMIVSRSGLAEQDCVFSTPHHGKTDTLWYITVYDPQHYKLEFLRFTPTEEIVKINIELRANADDTTTSTITYQYTSLNAEKEQWIQNNFEKEFTESMRWWEKAINHYIQTGHKLLKHSA